jgi:hypothetical protein
VLLAKLGVGRTVLSRDTRNIKGNWKLFGAPNQQRFDIDADSTFCYDAEPDPDSGPDLILPV